MRLRLEPLEDRFNPVSVTVDTLSDVHVGGKTTLHEAIDAVNASTDQKNTINLAVQGTISLSTVLPTLMPGGTYRDLTITGTGRDKLSVERAVGASTDFRIFKTGDKANVTISGLTIAGGYLVGSGPGDYNGGGIYVGFSLTLTDCAVKLNQVSGDGGGIYVEGDAWLKLNNTVVQSNQGGNGDGIAVGGASVEVNDPTQPRVDIKQSSQVSNNSAQGVGGGIYVAAPTAAGVDRFRILDSSVSQNKAQLTGGGLYVATGADMTGTITNSKFLENQSVTGSGGAFFTGGKVTGTNSSFDGNKGGSTSGYAISVDASIEAVPVTMTNCSVSNNRYLPPPPPPGSPPPPPLPSSAVDTGTGKIAFTDSTITGNDGNGVRGTVVSGGGNTVDNSAASSTGWQAFPIDDVS